MFSKATKIVNIEQVKNEENKTELTIPNIQTIFSELDKGNTPQELHFFFFFFFALPRQDLLQENKIKIYLKSSDVFIKDKNTGESIYDFLIA